ncbi:hypothetical protein NBO_364g0014 [Nosema bombycis CQ1]|uniref:Uncharacterized protein n=1 Tax=Nosema bombycis (strain CQ1 / CVCC 102059) TaxID=578461 RepID=R0MJ46_NOSB1|nr:hypothetical protein NBO_364g0014 [Nosema bombycis CQ1]|eukprot:EOB12808.1 hypothetical protein NBO_364g0014 [Nosema bombycis CQ1]
MFTSLNENTSSDEQKRNFKREKLKLKKIYYNFLLNNKLDDIWNYKLQFEENRGYYERIRENALYNFVQKSKRLNIEKYQLTKYSKPLLEYISLIIDDNQLLKARKLLNIAKGNGFTCNKYYELDLKIREKR